MKVTLLNSYKNEATAKQGAAICIDKFNQACDTNLQSASNSGHYSVLEHLPMTFHIEDVSRSLSHQFVRHRHNSPSQQSQRYAKVNMNNDWYVIPNSISSNETEIPWGEYDEYAGYTHIPIYDAYERLMSEIGYLYDKMLANGIPSEDARYILPNGCFTSFVVSMNGRSLIEQCQLRICHKAQWEIQELYKLMRECIKDVYPTVYRLAVPKCVGSKCPESKPCGKPWRKT